MDKISARMRERTTLSFEVFPPKTEKGMANMPDTLAHLAAWNPDYISCTYGAGGGNIGKNREVLKMVQETGRNVTPVTHFTCVGLSKDQIREQLQKYLDQGIHHVLALRGDLPYGWTGTNGDLHYASDLVAFIRREFGDQFEIGVAGSPEGHIQAESLEADIAHLKQKQDAGADYILTQLTYDMEQFKCWYDAIRRAGITIPVDAGVMPVLKKNAVLTQCLSRNGCAIPRELAVIFSHHWFDSDPDGNDLPEVKEAFRQEGMNFTVHQIHQYMALGVNGIHLYSMNRWQDVDEILQRAGIRTRL